MASIRRTSPQGIAAQLDLSTNLKVMLVEESSDITDALWNSATTLADFTYTRAGADSIAAQTAASVTLTTTGSQVYLNHDPVTFSLLAANVPDLEHVLYAIDVGGGDLETLWVPLICVDVAAQPDGTDYTVDPGGGLVIWETDSE